MKQKIYVAIKTFNSKKTACPNQSGEYICEDRVCPNLLNINCEGIHKDCLSCGKNIEHPLCPDCIAKGFQQWIQQFPQDRAKLQIRLDEFLEAHRYLDGKSKKCIACGKNNTHICPYCFTEYLYKIIKEAGLGVRTMSEFLFIFNFDFDHQGYSKELEVYGGY
ncbi:hypothetical protein KAJ38_01955 [Candidatus Pacearchaeota archaeon]|nr:hypothetical protein [Candidatus Pacearchaeota archaeon]